MNPTHVPSHVSQHIYKGQPLELLPLDTLWDMGTPEADNAVKTRLHAFHEAGHAWAACRADTGSWSASPMRDAPTLYGSTDEKALWIATMGPIVQGLLVEGEGVQVGELAAPGTPAMLLLEDIDAFPGWQIREHLCGVRDCCCTRGGDEIAADALDDEEWIERELPLVLTDWIVIMALANALLTNQTLAKSTIHILLGEQPL